MRLNANPWRGFPVLQRDRFRVEGLAENWAYVKPMRTSALFLIWCGLLRWAHVASPDPDVLDLPISSFRDGSEPLIGYLLFCVLIAAILSHAQSWWVRREFWSARVCLAVAAGLGIVAVTPSYSSFHDFMALAVIGFGYLYFTVSLYRESLEWNDPFMRSIHRNGVVSMKIPPRDRRVARIWQGVMVLHQGVLLLALILIFMVYQSGGLFQKFIVTHLLLLMAILEILPRRRPQRSTGSPQRKSSDDR